LQIIPKIHLTLFLSSTLFCKVRRPYFPSMKRAKQTLDFPLSRLLRS
jgi:hypothetical protein